MSNYQKRVDEIVELICAGVKKKNNYILVGDNSSGKSDVLFRTIKKHESGDIYFIDSINRTFDISKVELIGRAYEYVNLEPGVVLEERLSPVFFNVQDSFKAMGCIEQLYKKYQKQIVSMCKDFLGVDIQIIRRSIEAGLAENVVLIDGVEAMLSSGYQAVVRIFCEILYYCDVLEAQKIPRGLLVIDEIDEYLSPNYSSKILSFLQAKFPELSFLVATHSVDLVEGTENADLIVLQSSNYEVFDADVLGNMISAKDIFANLFFEDRQIHKSDDDEIDEDLRRFLNMKIADCWDQQMQKKFEEIRSKELLPHQKMLCKQIEEW